jgi:hypothetical protein
MFNLNRYWLLLGTLLVGYTVFEYYRPKPLDWNYTYSNKDDIPYGTEAVFRLLPQMIGKFQVETVREPVYNRLAEDTIPAKGKKNTEKTTYMFVNTSFDVDENDQKALLDYVAKGNTVFISSYDFPDSIMVVLGVNALLDQPSTNDTAKYVNFENPRLRDRKGHIFPKDDGRNYFQIRDVQNTTVLASNDQQRPVFVSVEYGKGKFYLHNLPLAFTNYFVVNKETNPHVFKALSYLPNQPVLWDEYQKQGRFNENENSVFRYIVSQPALKIAYMLTLSGLLLFAIFTGKRRQRIIPLINPPSNISLEFVKTIGHMYYQKRNHQNLAEKLIYQFWFYVRGRFGFTSGQENEKEIFEAMGKTGALSEVELLTLQTEINDDHRKWTGDRLMKLNALLEKFYEGTR